MQIVCAIRCMYIEKIQHNVLPLPYFTRPSTIIPVLQLALYNKLVTFFALNCDSDSCHVDFQHL